ncbi:MAG: PAS domain S-box protein [Deltaproteobacteria bacterium]|nr:PAS domain S-box protein [Deltaproteobacteria bacterium]
MIRLLLIEDDDSDALLITNELRRCGYEVMWERVDSAAALEAALAGQRWDAITCDWVIPSFSASAALEILCRCGVDVPIIVVTGEVGEEVAVSAMRAGAHDVVSKRHLARLVPAIERELRETEVRRARKRAEDALKESERRFRSLIEKALDLVGIVEADGTIRYASPSHEEATGYKPEELVGKNAFDFVHPDDRARVLRGYASGLRFQEQRGSTEYRFRRKDGSWCVIEGVARDLTNDPLVRGVLVNSRDISKRKQAEHILRERTRLVDAVFEHSVSCLVLLDRHFNFVRVNPAYARACRREVDDFVGRNHFDLYPSDARAIFEQVVETKQPFCTIARPFSFPDQPERGVTYWDWTLVPLLDEHGEVEFLLFSLHDVTEHVRALDVVRANEERLQVALQVADIAAFNQDRDLRYTWMDNPQLGYSLEQVLGRTDADLLPSGVAERIMEIKRGVIETNVGAREEVRVDSDDGRTRYYDLAVKPLCDAAGKVVGLTGASFDITERKRAEEALRADAVRLETLQEIYRAILEARSIPALAAAALRRIRQLIPCDLAILLLFDVETQVARVVAVEAIDPERVRDIVEFPLGDFSALSALAEHPEISLDDIAGLVIRSPMIERLASPGLHSVLIEALIVEGKILGTLNLAAVRRAAFTADHCKIAREVADQLSIAIHQTHLHEQLQRHAAELEQRVRERTAQHEAANRELAAFSYSVSHDLRVPLRLIGSFGEILQEEYATTLPAQGREYIERIVAAATRMGQLIQDLLTLSHVVQREMTSVPVNLSELAQLIVEDLRRAAPQRRVEFVTAPDLVATGDPGLLRIVLENLLGNAWKYTSKHSSARIEFGRFERDGVATYFVRDDGAGFDMKSGEKLFGAFQRLHSASEFEGTGIGLATVQRIIQRHGGRVWAESAVGEGATFYFTLGS